MFAVESCTEFAEIFLIPWRGSWCLFLVFRMLLVPDIDLLFCSSGQISVCDVCSALVGGRVLCLELSRGANWWDFGQIHALDFRYFRVWDGRFVMLSRDRHG